MATPLQKKITEKLSKAFDGKVYSLADDGLRAGGQFVIPSGIDVVDHYLIGCGGFPCGLRGVTEMFSAEGGGKSSLLYTLIANAQRIGVASFLADTECSLDADRSDVFGVDREQLTMLEADHMEELFSMVESTLDCLPGPPASALIGWDSLALTPTKEEVDKGILEKAVMDRRAGIISRSLRVLASKAAEKNAAFVVVNQPRTKIGVMFGDPTTTPGGQALKSTASLRLVLYPGKHIEVRGEKVGRFVTLSVKKNRFAPPRKVSLKLLFGSGFDNVWSTLELAKTLGMIGPRERGVTVLRKAYEALATRFPGFSVVDAESRVELLVQTEAESLVESLESELPEEAVTGEEGADTQPEETSDGE